MERRHFLKLAFGVVAGTAALAASAKAALLMPQPLADDGPLPPGPEVGRLLARAREAQALGLVTTREEALAELARPEPPSLDTPPHA